MGTPSATSRAPSRLLPRRALRTTNQHQSVRFPSSRPVLAVIITKNKQDRKTKHGISTGRACELRKTNDACPIREIFSCGRNDATGTQAIRQA